MKSTRFADHTRDEVLALAPDATVVVPIGSIEQHGPHLPVQADAAIVTHVAERAVAEAARTVPVVVTPTLPFGLAQHHLPFGGTVSLSAKVYLDLLTEIGTSLAGTGFRRILFLNGHGGNVNAASMVADRLAYECKLDVRIAATSYWVCAEESLAALDLGGAPVPGHAGSFETSCLMALCPEMIATDRIPSPEPKLQPLVAQSDFGASLRLPGIWQRSDGRTDDSRRASAEVGHKALEMISTDVCEFIVRFHHAEALVAPEHAHDA